MVTERRLKTWANACQVSKIWNKIKPEKQSQKALSSWHMRGISTSKEWQSVLQILMGWLCEIPKVVGEMCEVCTCVLPFPLLLPSKTLAILAFNDIALRWLPHCLSNVWSTWNNWFTRNVQMKRLLMLQCSLFSLWGEEWGLPLWIPRCFGHFHNTAQ